MSKQKTYSELKQQIINEKPIDEFRQARNMVIEGLSYSELKKYFIHDTVYDTQINEAKELAKNRSFVINHSVMGIRELTDSFSINNKIDFDLKDGSTICIDKSTYELLEKLNIDTDIINYMSESKKRFIEVITQLTE